MKTNKPSYPHQHEPREDDGSTGWLGGSEKGKGRISVIHQDWKTTENENKIIERNIKQVLQEKDDKVFLDLPEYD